MLSAIGTAIGYIVGILRNPTPAGSEDESISVAIITLTGALKLIATAFDQLFSRTRQAWQAAQADITNIEHIVRDIARWEQSNWTRLLKVILPNSQAWVLGAVHKWADHKFLPRTWLQSKQWLTTQSNARVGFRFWQANHGWLSTFHKHDWPVLLRWQLKRAEPQIAQLWALNPQANPLEPVILDKAANYLHSKKGATDLYNLTGLIVGETPALWRNVEAAILAILNTPYP